MQIDKIRKIYDELSSLMDSLMPNENKANSLRKLFERVLKLYLGYKSDDTHIDLFTMIDEYVLKSQRHDLQYASHQLRKDLNPWSHDTSYKLENNTLKEYYLRFQNIIKEITGISPERLPSIVSSFSIDKLDLNPEQKEAVLSKNRLTLVNAGPGTGKTYLIVGRILNELNTNNNKKIFGLSFTNKASEELQHKLDNQIFSTSLIEHKKNVFTGTLHSFALKFIQDYFEVNNKTFDFIIIDDIELKDIQGEFNNDEESLNDYLKENKILTFDMIIDMFLNTIKNNNNFQKFLSEKLDEIVIDEAQDLDKLQYEILYLLYKHISHLKLFFVGDPRQNIYAFKGGSLNNIRLFSEETDASFIELKYSYRCPQIILSFVNKFKFKDNDNTELKDAYNKTSGSLSLQALDNKEDEANWIAKLIVEKKNDNIKLSDIAIIYTSTFYFKEILESLNAFEIPFKVFGGQWVINNNIRVFRFILSLIHTNNKYALKNIQKYWINCVLEGDTIDEILISLSDMDFTNKANYEKLQLILKFIQEEQTKKNAVINILDHYISVVKKKNILLEQDIEMLDNLKDIILNDLTLDNYDKLKLSFSPMHPKLNIFYTRSDEIVESEWYSNDKAFISVTTVHSAKGLEWDNVIIPGMAQDSFPRYFPDNESREKEMPNELKKFYVACTRSKENLYLTRPKEVTVKSKKNGQYYTFSRDISVFLNNI